MNSLFSFLIVVKNLLTLEVGTDRLSLMSAMIAVRLLHSSRLLRGGSLISPISPKYLLHTLTDERPQEDLSR